MRKFSASPQIKLLNTSLAQALKQKNYQSAAAGGPVGGVSHAPTSKYSSAAIFQNTIAPKPPTQVIQQPAPPQIQQPAQHHQHQQSVDYDAFFSPILGKSVDYDAFFSPILGKVDQIFTSMGVYDEPCRERLVCNMYRTPNKYSPHSNLVSNELSRDPSELPKAAKISVPALRFYKYVQAARDGQDNNDCAKLYATCSKSL
ncbi:hypothetical protein M8J77_011378 [Diaphorina citri]|nr:hypothetical protein M8J77_011378 [Diaphorina citri]